MKYENKEYEYWEHMTYVICEVLAWRGIWLSEERRRIGNVDVGPGACTRASLTTVAGCWVARVLVEKHHIGLTELTNGWPRSRRRYADGLAGKDPEGRAQVARATGRRSSATSTTSTRWARATRRSTPARRGGEVQGR